MYDRSETVVQELVAEKAVGASSLADMVKKLQKPRALCYDDQPAAGNAQNDLGVVVSLGYSL